MPHLKQLDANIDPGPFFDLVHVIYPEDVYVTHEQVCAWAWDALVNRALDDYVRENGVLSEDADGDLIMAQLIAANPKPTDIEEAKEILSDLGTHTFARV